MAAMATVLLQKSVADSAVLLPDLRNFLFSEQKVMRFPSCSGTHRQSIHIYYDSECPDVSVVCSSNR
jgi:hypothetical protein